MDRTAQQAYQWAIENRPSSIAVGLAGDSVPCSFQRKSMAETRLAQSDPRFRDGYRVVGIGEKAGRRWYVVPTLETYLKRAAETGDLSHAEQ